MLTSDKINFKRKVVLRAKEGHFIMIKESIHQEDMPIINIHVSITRTPNYKQTWTELKGEMDNSARIFEISVLHIQ